MSGAEGLGGVAGARAESASAAAEAEAEAEAEAGAAVEVEAEAELNGVTDRAVCGSGLRRGGSAVGVHGARGEGRDFRRGRSWGLPRRGGSERREGEAWLRFPRARRGSRRAARARADRGRMRAHAARSVEMARRRGACGCPRPRATGDCTAGGSRGEATRGGCSPCPRGESARWARGDGLDGALGRRGRAAGGASRGSGGQSTRLARGPERYHGVVARGALCSSPRRGGSLHRGAVTATTRIRSWRNSRTAVHALRTCSRDTRRDPRGTGIASPARA